MPWRVQRLGWVLFASIVTLLTAAKADAAGNLLVSLDYSADSALPGCPLAADFRRSVSQQLSYDPFRDGTDRRVIVRVQATEDGIEGRVEWRDASGTWAGERKFLSRVGNCQQLARGMAFGIAVQIQFLGVTTAPVSGGPTPPPPVGENSASGPGGPGGPPPVPPLVVATEPVAGPQAAFSRARRPSFAIGVGPSAALGMAPGPNAQGRIFATLLLARTSFELGAEAALPSTTREPDGSGFSQYAFALTMAGCGHLKRLGACLIGRIGQIRLRGLGVDVPNSPSGTTAQAGLRFAATQNLSERFFAMAHADMLTTLTPWTVTLNQTDVWTTPRFAVLAGLDIAMRF